MNQAGFKGGLDTKAIEEAWINEANKMENNNILKINATHSVLELKLQEIRFDKRHTIAQIKAALEYRFGSPVANQSLTLKDDQNNIVAEMSNDASTLDSYGAVTGYLIHVTDSDPCDLFTHLNDPNAVPKYEMSEEDYAHREDSFRNFKKKMMAKNPNFMNAHNQAVVPDYQKEEADAINVDDRCQTLVGDKKGNVRFVGKVPELAGGFWVGIELDDQLGDNNGNIQGTQYFVCVLGHGMFIRPKEITVGDFPPEVDFDMDEDMI